VWFISLICAVCLEGLGRRYLSFIPSAFFYFLKDAILIAGYIRFRPSLRGRGTARYLYRGFDSIWLFGFFWTVDTLLNPLHHSLFVGLMGMRAYWLWWSAPAIIAGVLQQREHKERAIYALVALCGLVSLMAAWQFASPADASANMYTVLNGEELYASDL